MPDLDHSSTTPAAHAASAADRRLLLAGIGTGVIGIIGVAFLSHVVGGGITALNAVGRPLLFAAIGTLAVQGRGWARVVLALWTGGLALFNAVAAINLLREGHLGGAAMFLGLGAIFLASVMLLVRAGRTGAPHLALPGVP